MLIAQLFLLLLHDVVAVVGGVDGGPALLLGHLLLHPELGGDVPPEVAGAAVVLWWPLLALSALSQKYW